MSTLLDVKRALSNELGSDVAFLFINTRLILRTGVDLNQAEVVSVEPERLALVKQELREMGYLNGLDP